MALLCVSAIASYVSFSYFRVGEQWVSHTQEVRAAVGDLEYAVNAAARARVGYLMSGAESDLAEFNAAVARIPAKLLHLRELTNDNPLQINNCAQLESLLATREQAWNDDIQRRQAGTTINLSDMLQQNVRLTADFAAGTEAIRSEEHRLLEIRTRSAHRRFLTAIAAVGASFILALLLLYFHFLMLTRELKGRTEAQEALRKTNEELAGEVAERRAAEGKLAVSEASLRELSLHLLRSQEEERKRIGRELHDSLGQYLAMLKLNLDLLDGSPDAATNRDQISQCVHLAEESMREVRTISYLLYPPMLEEVGLKSAIPWYLEGFSTRSNVQTSFEIDSQLGRLSRDVELALFRVLQESLTNVHRHSGSPTASVRLLLKNGNAVLEVADQGRGIAEKSRTHTDGEWHTSLGVGVRGMNERMRQLGGRLEITSSPKGTVVTAVVPTKQPAAGAANIH
jgi:signal transduction histidine kinase